MIEDQNNTMIVHRRLFNTEQLRLLVSDVFKNISFLELSYPAFKQWYFNTVIPGIMNGTRAIIIEWRNGKMAGLSIIKDTVIEKKICTIYVSPEFQRKGLGIKLFEKSMCELNTDRPLLSVSEDRLYLFDKMFNHFGYHFTSEYNGLYLPNKSEFSFNGRLVF